MDNQELFKKILNTFYEKGYTELRVITHEDYIMHTFDWTSPEEALKVRERAQAIRDNGWAQPKPAPLLNKLPNTDDPFRDYVQESNYQGIPRAVNTWVSIIYRPKKDAISVNELQLGYGYNSHKHRWYPIKKSTPKLSYSSTGLWHFNGNRQPRVLKGGFEASHGVIVPYVDWVVRDILGISYDWKGFKFTWKNFVGTADQFELLEKMYGARIPKALRYLSADDLQTLVKVIKPNDMNRLCQVLASEPKGPGIIGTPSLATLLTKLFGTGDYHTIRDWIEDHESLGEKMNLSISSLKRIQDMHRRMSYARVIKDVKYVKPHAKYAQVLTAIAEDVSVEFIRTKDRLLDETVKMAHCVATYAHKINNGDSAIFHLEYQGIPYTLEVCDKEQVLNITPRQFLRNQLRGFANSEAPAELIFKIDQALSDYNHKLELERTTQGVTANQPKEEPAHELVF